MIVEAIELVETAELVRIWSLAGIIIAICIIVLIIAHWLDNM